MPFRYFRLQMNRRKYTNIPLIFPTASSRTNHINNLLLRDRTFNFQGSRVEEGLIAKIIWPDKSVTLPQFVIEIFASFRSIFFLFKISRQITVLQIKITPPHLDGRYLSIGVKPTHSLYLMGRCGRRWSYGSWIYNYLCNQCLSPLKLWVLIQIMSRCTWRNIMW